MRATRCVGWCSRSRPSRYRGGADAHVGGARVRRVVGDSRVGPDVSRRARSRGLAVDAVDASEPLLEYETTRERGCALSTVYADAAPAAPTPRRASVEDETMEVMMPMPWSAGNGRRGGASRGYSRL